MAVGKTELSNWLHRKVVDPFLLILRSIVVFIHDRQAGILNTCVFLLSWIWITSLFSCRGSEPKQLAFSASLGFTLGIFPICGVTVFLCGMAIALLGSYCHAPTVMLANFMATPIELSLIVPFVRFGEVITGGPHFPLTTDALKKVITGQASREVALSIAHALFGWLVAAPFVLGTLHMVFLPFFKILVRKFGSAPSSPKKLNHPLAEVKVKVRDV